MGVAKNSVENGKAMWGKLDVVQGFLNLQDWCFNK